MACRLNGLNQVYWYISRSCPYWYIQSLNCFLMSFNVKSSLQRIKYKCLEWQTISTGAKCSTCKWYEHAPTTEMYTNGIRGKRIWWQFRFLFSFYTFERVILVDYRGIIRFHLYFVRCVDTSSQTRNFIGSYHIIKS